MNPTTHPAAWLNWKGTHDPKTNTMHYPRPYIPAIDTTAPNYLRDRFAEIRNDQSWADYMNTQSQLTFSR